MSDITEEIIRYQGQPVIRRGEMMSLTDMWRAGGSEKNKAPYEWLRSSQAKSFAAFLADTGISRSVERGAGGRGGGGVTWAHWQLAFAYAKYLSPAFHAWCNEVVRAHLEHGGDPVDIATLRARIAELEASLNFGARLPPRIKVKVAADLSPGGRGITLFANNPDECAKLWSRIRDSAKDATANGHPVTPFQIAGMLRNGRFGHPASYRFILLSEKKAVHRILRKIVDGKLRPPPRRARTRRPKLRLVDERQAELFSTTEARP